MVFSSGVFLFVFFPVLLAIYYAAKNKSIRNYILLFTSLLFYAWGEPVFIFVMIFSIALNYFLALKISASLHKKFWLSLAIIFDVFILGVFKYTGFILENFSALTRIHTPQINIALPIGISFFTFQMMSYVFDVYYEKSRAQKNFFDVALYISFFPQLIAGPIVRYNQIESEIENRRENFSDFSEGVRRFIYGLGKKILLANFLAQIADNIFGYIINPSVLMAWLGAVAYTLQIYFDFSGYSDMAIGLGLMFGFHFEENFNYPYISKSISEFWRRWHISLSTWFRDYVYIPMGGNRSHAFRNIFVVWLLTGIWHGANWTFILWGMIYFFLLMLERNTQIISRLGIFSHVYTIIAVILAWVIFRSDTVAAGLKYIASMFALNGNKFFDYAFIDYIASTWPVIIFSFVSLFPVVKFFERHERAECFYLASIFLLSIFEVASSSYNPFIYFNF